jgi:hypothetical protein
MCSPNCEYTREETFPFVDEMTRKQLNTLYLFERGEHTTADRDLLLQNFGIAFLRYPLACA